MAKASSRTLGEGAKGKSKDSGKGTGAKGDGTGAMSSTSRAMVGDNVILSNRDKAQESRTRGADSRFIMNDQRQDQAHNRDEEHAPAPDKTGDAEQG